MNRKWINRLDNSGNQEEFSPRRGRRCGYNGECRGYGNGRRRGQSTSSGGRGFGKGRGFGNGQGTGRGLGLGRGWHSWD